MKHKKFITNRLRSPVAKKGHLIVKTWFC